MKTYTYRTAEEPITIEVNEKWHQWLIEADYDEVKQKRRDSCRDHKYVHGSPISLDSVENPDDWLTFVTTSSYSAIELMIDFEMALETLTPLQRKYFVMNRIQGYAGREIARLESKDEAAIRRSIEGAEKKIKSFFA